MPSVPFIVIGENIHCTRILKRGGPHVDEAAAAIRYRDAAGRPQALPIPAPFLKAADWEQGKVKHCAAAVWQGLRGQGAAREAGGDYLRVLALKQREAGAAYLDVNVDEYGADAAERRAAMAWTVRLVQEAARLPVSLDSSNSELLRAGLTACDPALGRPLLNSISLERLGLLDVVAEHRPAVIASAAGERGLPATVAERLDNFRRLVPQLTGAALEAAWIHLDPLVYTISTDAANGRAFLDAVRAVRADFGPALHVVGGLSNVSFGMPARKLINQVFAWLAVEAGADGGIVDPLQINAGVLRGLDPASAPFRLARALLLGEDEFGAAFIAAHREGQLEG